MSELRDCDDIVDFLVKHPFNSLSNHSKAYIISKQRPRPEVLALKSTPQTQKRGFNPAWYDRLDWLTASVKRQKLYCWPCLLFTQPQDHTVWSSEGFDSLRNLPGFLDRHSKSKEHISMVCKLKLIEKNSLGEVKNPVHNDQIAENRKILMRLIDLTVFSAAHDSSGTCQNIFNDLVSLFKKYDATLNSFIAFTNTSPDTLHNFHSDLIDVICTVLKTKIQEEVVLVDFFSWQVTEIANTSLFSIILRYCKNGRIVERFLGLHEFPADRTADNLCSYLLNFFEQYCLENKLISQSYGGAVVIPNQLRELQEKVKSVAPQALFTHSCAYDLNVLLYRACTSIKECRDFFAKLDGFSKFFSKSSKITNILNAVCGEKLCLRLVICWSSISHTISTLHDNIESLSEIFDAVINSEDFTHCLDYIREAAELKRYLEDPNFVFMLATFKLIFDETDNLQVVLQNNLEDEDTVLRESHHVKLLVNKLQSFRDDPTFFDQTYDFITSASQRRWKKPKLCSPQMEQNARILFDESLTIIIEQIEVRFADIDKLQFFKLLGFKDPGVTSIPDIRVQCYPFFDSFLKTDIQVVYGDRKLFENCLDKSPQGMLKFMCESGLDTCLPHLFKLLALIATIPVTVTASSESILKRVETHCARFGHQNPPSKLALIAIEKDFVSWLSRDDAFYDEINERFAKINRHSSVPLLYEKV